MVVVGSVLAWAQPAADFTYDDRGKRDPFAPLVGPGGALISYDSEMTISDMHLQGIIGDAQGSIAIINGKVVKASEMVGGYQVHSIGTDEVDLVKDQQHFTLKLKKGGI